MPAPGRFPADGAALLVVDLQAKLMPPAMSRGPLVIANARRLIEAATALTVPVFATEQYPQGLGPTVEELIPLLPERLAKTEFSAAGAVATNVGIRHVTVVGIETHVCVLQTALDLIERGLGVQVVMDAVASRGPLDHHYALERMRSHGIIVTTAEAALFEWVGDSRHPAFKVISNLVKQFVPPDLSS